ncbi:hypothetical protein GYMLUDRAFT_176507, partial [Collybiopsis luxurians FD-317 M1]
DGPNYSCAYDSILTSLNILCLFNPSCFQKMSDSSTPVLKELCKSFNLVHQNRSTLHSVCESFRDWISQTYPNKFPRYGQIGRVYDEVLNIILTHNNPVSVKQRSCVFCGHLAHSQTNIISHFYATNDTPNSVSNWIAYVQGHCSNTPCLSCLASSTMVTTTFCIAPSLLLFHLNHRNDIEISNQFHINVNGNQHLYNLKAIIYYGLFHFTSRSLKNNSIWYHDGVTTDVNLMTENSICVPQGLHQASDNRRAICIIYAGL